jgi:hypothetical protein
VVHALKTLRPYLLDEPFQLQSDNASVRWITVAAARSSSITLVTIKLAGPGLNLLAEYQYHVVRHIPGRTNPIDFLSASRTARLRRRPAARTAGTSTACASQWQASSVTRC